MTTKRVLAQRIVKPARRIPIAIPEFIPQLPPGVYKNVMVFAVPETNKFRVQRGAAPNSVTREVLLRTEDGKVWCSSSSVRLLDDFGTSDAVRSTWAKVAGTTLKAVKDEIRRRKEVKAARSKEFEISQMLVKAKRLGLTLTGPGVAEVADADAAMTDERPRRFTKTHPPSKKIAEIVSATKAPKKTPTKRVSFTTRKGTEVSFTKTRKSSRPAKVGELKEFPIVGK